MDKIYFCEFEQVSISNVLSSFEHTKPILLITLGIYPRVGETGMLEERRNWLRQFWERVLLVTTELSGCSLLWTKLFFVTNEVNKSEIINQFQIILQDMQDNRFLSFCIFGIASGVSEDRIMLLDVMNHELASKTNFGNGYPDLVRLLDGKHFT